MRTKIAWGVLILLTVIAIVLLCLGKKSQIKPQPTPVQQVVKVQQGTKTQGGTYYRHEWQDTGFAIQIKAHDGTIYEFVVDSSAEVILMDQIKGTRTVMTASQMQDWLTNNKSPELCTFVGVYKGKVDGLIVLIPRKDDE